MNKILNMFLCLSFVIVLSSVAFAAEKVVQLNVPGCRPCGAAKRINTVMKKINGVIKYETKGHDLLLITFDDKKTNLKVIVDELEKDQLLIKGKPMYLK
jgi:hypothetical protein